MCRYIEANGGLYNIVVVPMWAGQQSSGSWSFMSYCQNPVFFGTAACNQVRCEIIWGGSSLCSPQLESLVDSIDCPFTSTSCPTALKLVRMAHSVQRWLLKW